jgi:peptidoglycan hydrolase CwlO-like protein
MKQKNTIKQKTLRRLTGAGILVSVVVFVLATFVAPNVRADQFDDQIAALQQQNAAVRGTLGDLRLQAASYQDAIGKLQQQIDALQAQIDANIAQQKALQAQIDANQLELDRQRHVLGEDIKSMYVDGQPSTIEMLATSRNLSDFVDKEEYRNSVQAKIQETLAKINTLQKELGRQKVAVEDLLKGQQQQQGSLDLARHEQAQMLAYNQGQQAAYNQQIASNQSKIGDLRKQQAILNARYDVGSMKGDPNNGGYPGVWANARQDSMLDTWGMYNRECVSYVAYMVHQDYLAGKNNRDMPGWGWSGLGDAKMWDENAQRMGIPVDGNPTPGAVAVSNAGQWGHVMYVAAVGTMNGRQAIYIQQYNASFTGQYSEGWRYTDGLVFIHF